MRWRWWRRSTPSLPPEAVQVEAQLRDLEERADRASQGLRDRLDRNHFAEGLAVAWGRKGQA